MNEVTLNDVITIMNERFDRIETDFKNEISSIKSDLADVKSDVRSIKLYQENVLDKDIKLLAENVSAINTRLSTYDNDITALKDEQVISDVVLQIPNIINKK